MSKSQIDLSKVDDLIEATIRFHLFAEQNPQQVPDWRRNGRAVVEAGVLLLSASLQAFVEDVFLECSEKAFKNEFQGKELKLYRATWARWGNPSPKNIRHLFRRLGCVDVWEYMSMVGLEKEEFLNTLEMMNSVRNCIAHGQPARYNGQNVLINLSKLREWRRHVDIGCRAFRFCAMRQSGIGAGGEKES